MNKDKNHELFTEAMNIPRMTKYNIYILWHKKGLRDEFGRISAHLGDSATIEDTAFLYNEFTINELRQMSQIMCAAVANYAFREVVGKSVIDDIKRFQIFMDDNQVPFTHDLRLVAHAPYASGLEFEAWMDDGFDVEFDCIAKALEWTDDPEAFMYRHFKCGRVFSFNARDVIDKERLTGLYDGWSVLYTYWMSFHEDTNSYGAGEYINAGRDNRYSKVVKYLIDIFGVPKCGHTKSSIGPDFHASSYKLTEFENYVDSTYGDAEQFMYGSMGKIGFYEDIKLLANAIAAQNDGKDSVTCTLIYDMNTGEENTFELRVPQILSKDRCYKFAEAIRRGMNAARSYEERGDVNCEEYIRLHKLGLVNPRLPEFEIVYSYMLNAFPVSTPTTVSVSDRLASMVY